MALSGSRTVIRRSLSRRVRGSSAKWEAGTATTSRRSQSPFGAERSSFTPSVVAHGADNPQDRGRSALPSLSASRYQPFPPRQHRNRRTASSSPQRRQPHRPLGGVGVEAGSAVAQHQRNPARQGVADGAPAKPPSPEIRRKLSSSHSFDPAKCIALYSNPTRSPISRGCPRIVASTAYSAAMHSRAWCSSGDAPVEPTRNAAP